MNQELGKNTAKRSPPHEEGKGEVVENHFFSQPTLTRPPLTPPPSFAEATAGKYEGEESHTSVMLSGVILALIFLFALVIRWHNLFAYNTWWADDGGAHVEYVQTILEAGRLPTPTETYLAWHEPLYYVATAGWAKVGQWLGHPGLNWWEGLQVIISLAFLWLVWLLAKLLTQNRWLSLLIVFLFSILFVSVKLSAYLSNELAVQTLMLLCVYLWLRWKLWEEKKYRQVLWWSVLLGLAMLTKLTAVIVLLAALLVWAIIAAVQRRRFTLDYAALCLLVVVVLNVPWFAYKQKYYGSAFSINLVERGNAQSVLKSQGWTYLLALNPRIFTTQPYWFGAPQSFASIALGDTFGDYYNLFADPDQMEKLPARVQTGNGRYTTPQRWTAMVWANRLGAAIAVVWIIGVAGFVVQLLRARRWEWGKLWLIVLIAGAWAALAYNVLRYPYLERGVLKAAFIFFSFPILAILASQWWWEKFENGWVRGVVLALPIVTYAIAVFPMVWV